MFTLSTDPNKRQRQLVELRVLVDVTRGADVERLSPDVLAAIAANGIIREFRDDVRVAQVTVRTDLEASA